MIKSLIDRIVKWVVNWKSRIFSGLEGIMEGHRLQNLQLKHLRLESLIHEEMSRPLPCSSTLQKLKKQKLLIREQLMYCADWTDASVQLIRAVVHSPKIRLVFLFGSENRVWKSQKYYRFSQFSGWRSRTSWSLGSMIGKCKTDSKVQRLRRPPLLRKL